MKIKEEIEAEIGRLSDLRDGFISQMRTSSDWNSRGFKQDAINGVCVRIRVLEWVLGKEEE